MGEDKAGVPVSRLPSADIFPVVRVDSSGTTELVTGYLSNDPGWTLGVGKSVAWPKCAQQVQGSDGVINYITAQKNAIGWASPSLREWLPSKENIPPWKGSCLKAPLLLLLYPLHVAAPTDGCERCIVHFGRALLANSCVGDQCCDVFGHASSLSCTVTIQEHWLVQIRCRHQVKC